MSSAKLWRGWSNTGENPHFSSLSVQPANVSGSKIRCSHWPILLDSIHLDSRPSFSFPFHPRWKNPSAGRFQVREELTIESAGQTRAAADTPRLIDRMASLRAEAMRFEGFGEDGDDSEHTASADEEAAASSPAQALLRVEGSNGMRLLSDGRCDHGPPLFGGSYCRFDRAATAARWRCDAASGGCGFPFGAA